MLGTRVDRRDGDMVVWYYLPGPSYSEQNTFSSDCIFTVDLLLSQGVQQPFKSFNIMYFGRSSFQLFKVIKFRIFNPLAFMRKV